MNPETANTVELTLSSVRAEQQLAKQKMEAAAYIMYRKALFARIGDYLGGLEFSLVQINEAVTKVTKAGRDLEHRAENPSVTNEELQVILSELCHLDVPVIQLGNKKVTLEIHDSSAEVDWKKILGSACCESVLVPGRGALFTRSR